MGFNLNKALAAAEKNLKSFMPCDLNEGNVQAIFNRCLANRNDPSDDVMASTLFQHELGYDEDSKPVFFSKTRIKRDKKNIFYLLGQLNSVNDDLLRITSAESVYRYDGMQWTSDTVKLMELFHLGEATKGIHPFVKQSNTATISTLVTPTLSPKDPNFPAWWEAHKAEWER